METNVYSPCDDEIAQFQKQIAIDRILAIELLRKHDGNMLEAILESYSSTTQLTNSKPTTKYDIADESLSVGEKLQAFRNILDEKDAVFTKNIAKDINVSGVREFEYTAFNWETAEFLRQRYVGTEPDFMADVVNPYFGESTDSQNLTCKYMGNGAKRVLATKWGFHQSAMFYGTSESDTTNKLATTLLRKASYLSDSEEFKGSCIIVNKWFVS